MLQVKNLKVRVEDREILKGINLTVNKGEVHAIMGPNGSGKSTFARALSGHPGYEVTEGQVLYNGQDLLDMDPDERARAGVFMAFQYPVEIPGVNNAYFLKAALNAKRKQAGLDIDALRVVSDGVNAMRSPERSFVVVTHYQRLLNYIVPDYVHVLSDGKIVRSGGR